MDVTVAGTANEDMRAYWNALAPIVANTEPLAIVTVARELHP